MPDQIRTKIERKLLFLKGVSNRSSDEIDGVLDCGIWQESVKELEVILKVKPIAAHDLISAMMIPELSPQVIKLPEEMAELRVENERLQAENEELKRTQNRSAAPFQKGKQKKQRNQSRPVARL